jgi:hypothetical protein
MAMEAACEGQSFSKKGEDAFGRTFGNLWYGNGKGTIA